MHQIVINGIFYNHPLTGIERFSYEITRRLDSISLPGEFTLVLPSDAPQNIYSYKNIRTIRLPRTPGKKQFNRIKLQIYMILHHAICLDYGNNCQFSGHSVVFLHDIYCRVFPQDFVSVSDKKNRDRTCRMYKRISRRAEIIFTVSEFSKKQIIQFYHVDPKRIQVIYSGSDYMKSITTDNSIFIKYPILSNTPFYFTLGRLSLRKNLKWIAEHAEIYPNELFVISGTSLLNVIPPELSKLKTLQNVILAGYLSDSEVKALMQKCRAFVFPSYFEGFGLPPLEALSCGAPIIISKSASLPEIYENCAHAIYPCQPSVNLDSLLAQHIESPDKLFKKYSLAASAEKLYKILKKRYMNSI